MGIQITMWVFGIAHAAMIFYWLYCEITGKVPDEPEEAYKNVSGWC
jgi:hypothetical protein